MKMRRQRENIVRNQAKGAALAAALWLTALLTLMATTAATVSVTHRRSAGLNVEAVQAELVADSAIRSTLLRMMAPPPAQTAITLEKDDRIRLLDAAVDVRISRESIRTDLNAASAETLAALLATHGWDEQQGRTMANRILDWRDADDERREYGAERKEYREAQLRYRPRNAPFESVDEIRQVLGGEAVEQGLLETMTVNAYSRMTLQTNNPAGEGVSKFRQIDDSRMLVGEVLRIDACTQVNRARSCRRAIVRLTGNVENPLQVFVWHSIEISSRDKLD